MSRSEGKRGLRDLVLSLSVVGVFVAFLFAVTWRPAPDPVRTVDPAPMLAAAREQADYPVLAPVGLSPDWRATSARFEAGESSSTWFVGYVTPQDQYIAVTQTDGDRDAFIVAQTAGGVADGTVTVDGEQWHKYVAGDQRSLVRVTGRSTTVVTGTVSYEELAGFVGRLAA